MQQPIAFHPPGPGIVVGTAPAAALVAELERRMARGEGFSVATLNLDHVAKLRRLPGFRAAYLRHSHVTADGNPIVWLQRLAGRPVPLVTGADLIGPLAAAAARQGVPVALLGATAPVLERAAARLEAAHPGLAVVCRVAPPQGLDPEGAEALEALRQVAASGARLCLLALGAPKQEILAIRGSALMPQAGFVSIGAGLDFLAGSQQRAPAWLRRLALEWAWRLARDPRRLAGRYLGGALLLPGLGLAALRVRRQQRPPPGG